MNIHLLLVFSMLSASVILIIAAVITINQTIKINNPVLLGLGLMWFFYGFSLSLVTISHYFYEPFFLKICYIPQVIGVYFLVYFVDHIQSEKMDYIKIVVLAIIGSIYILAAWWPNSFDIIPEYGVHVSGYSRYTQIIFLFFYIYLLVSWALKTRRHSPLTIKRAANILLLGIFIFCVVSIVFYILGTVILELSALTFTVHALGIFITTIALIIEPKLLYVLPFKAHSILVIDGKNEKLLYEYRWSNIDYNKELVKNFVMGVYKFGKPIEIGDLKEITLNDNKIILSIQNNLLCGLLTSRSSSYLKENLKKFSNKFYSMYYLEEDKKKELIEKNKQIYTLPELGDILIDRYFTYIPTQDNLRGD